MVTTVASPASREVWSAALERVSTRKDAWTEVPVDRRVRYLRSAIDRMLRVAPDWVEEACRRRGVDPGSSLAGEEWVSGPAVTVRGMRLIRHALEHDGTPPLAGAVIERKRGHRVPVFPTGFADRILYLGMRAEVRLRPGAPATQGAIYRDKERGEFVRGRTALVLGAGNISSIAPLDVVTKMFAEDQTVVLKMNPVNDYLGPHLEEAFRELIEDGFLAVVYGGADAGEYLCADPRVDTIHLTGAARTHDAIVWGADPHESRRRKAAGTPLNDKPVTAELGCVTPVIVVPGNWSEGDLRFQAAHVAGMVSHNASFNCNAAKVLVTARGWDLRERFLQFVREALRSAPPRRAYYPGARDRYDAFLERYPSAEALGAGGDEVVPWTLLPDVPARAGEYALSEEAFCGVLAEVALDADGPEAFLDRATAFCNGSVEGTLSCVVLIHPRTRAAVRAAYDRALDDLRYGGIGVNVWAGLVYGLGNTTWGAFPGHTREDIGSGIGVVHNGLLLDHPEKSVLEAPFRQLVRPVYYPGHRTLRHVGRHLTTFEGRRSLPSFLGTLAFALFA